MLNVTASNDRPHTLCQYCFFREPGCSKLCGKTSSDMHQLKKKETLFYEGDRFKGLIQILNGTIKVTKYLDDGRRFIVGFYHRGDVIWLTTDGRYSYTAEAITDIKYTVFSLDWLSHDPHSLDAVVASRFLSFMCGDLEVSHDHMMLLARKSSIERLSSFLLQHAERMKTLDRGMVLLPMSRGDMADHLGMTTETVCRTLKKMKQLRVINIDHVKIIRFLNIDALQSFAEGRDELLPAV